MDTRPMGWLVAVRDHPTRPPSAQRLVLACLATRLDWTAGTGYCSHATMAADAGASVSTAKRATRWAVRAGLLAQTRRGHYISAGLAVASEWQLLVPAQGAMGDPLDPAQGVMSDPLAGGPKGSNERPKGPPVTPHPDTPTSRHPKPPLPPRKRRGRQPKPSVTDQRVAAALALAAEYERAEAGTAAAPEHGDDGW